MLNRIRAAYSAFRGAPRHSTRSALWNAGAADRRAAGWDAPQSDFMGQVIPPELLRRRSRHAVRNSAVAARAAAALTNNVIGCGIKPLVRTTDAGLKRKLQASWNRFVDSADFEGMRDLYALQALAYGHQIIDGEFLVRRIIDGGQLRCQILPAEFLDTTITRPNDSIIGGVEFDEQGRRVAYHVFQWHPTNAVRIPNSIRIPASEMLHVINGQTAGQVRGVTAFAPVLLKLNEAEQYDRATLVKAKVSALWGGFIRTSDDNSLNAKKGNDGAFTLSLEPGTIQKLDPNDEIEFPPHADVSPYSDFMKTLLRSIASGMGLPYSVLTGDLSDTSYASSRVGQIEFRKHVERLQWEFIFQFCRPVWRWWIELEVLAGRLPMPPGGIQEYIDVVTWTPPPMPLTDPQKEIDAKIKAIRAGLSSRDMEISGLGYDREEIDAQIAAGNAAADELGLVLDSDPRKVTMQGQQQQKGPGDEGSNAGADA
jgi:lambda family phage portal protein